MLTQCWPRTWILLSCNRLSEREHNAVNKCWHNVDRGPEYCSVAIVSVKENTMLLINADTMLTEDLNTAQLQRSQWKRTQCWHNADRGPEYCSVAMVAVKENTMLTQCWHNADRGPEYCSVAKVSVNEDRRKTDTLALMESSSSCPCSRAPPSLWELRRVSNSWSRDYNKHILITEEPHN